MSLETGPVYVLMVHAPDASRTNAEPLKLTVIQPQPGGMVGVGNWQS